MIFRRFHLQGHHTKYVSPHTGAYWKLSHCKCACRDVIQNTSLQVIFAENRSEHVNLKTDKFWRENSNVFDVERSNFNDMSV